jgi:uncharacterized damage-inducible protein DinB
MSSVDLGSLRGLATHMAWADAAVWTAALSSPRSKGDTRLQATFHHVHLVQHIFGAAWQGSSAAVRPATEFATPEDLARWGAEAHRSIDRFLATAPTQQQLDAEFREPWTGEFEAYLKRQAATHTLGESVLQAFMHSLHHRGQLCVRLRELDVTPPTVDYIVWLWAGRPSADWTVLETCDPAR